MVGPKRSSKAFPKARRTKKRSWSLFGGLLLVWSTTAFWILAKPLYLTNIFIKSMRCIENCNTCSQHWSTEKPNSSPLQCQTACHTTSISKVEQTGPRNFASSTIFTWPLANRLPLLQTSGQLFSGKMLPWAAGDRKWFLRVCQILKQGLLWYRNKQTYFLLEKMCWL